VSRRTLDGRQRRHSRIGHSRNRLRVRRLAHPIRSTRRIRVADSARELRSDRAYSESIPTFHVPANSTMMGRQTRLRSPQAAGLARARPGEYKSPPEPLALEGVRPSLCQHNTSPVPMGPPRSGLRATKFAWLQHLSQPAFASAWSYALRRFSSPGKRLSQSSSIPRRRASLQRSQC